MNITSKVYMSHSHTEKKSTEQQQEKQRQLQLRKLYFMASCRQAAFHFSGENLLFMLGSTLENNVL